MRHARVPSSRQRRGRPVQAGATRTTMEVRVERTPSVMPDGVDKTLPMGVANIGFMLERLGRDCDDLQFLREITENALEAQATQIVWDVDWTIWEATGAYKLGCIDNGV